MRTIQGIPSELLAELDAAKQSNIGCILHAEDRPQRLLSVWTHSVEQRRSVMRHRCGRPRRLEA